MWFSEQFKYRKTSKYRVQNTENTKKKNGKYRSEHRKNSILMLQTSQKHRKYTAKNSDFSTKIWDFWNVCLRIPFSEALSLTSSTTLYNNVFSAVQTNNLEFQTTDLTRVCNSKHNKIEKILNFYSPALKKYQNPVFEEGSCFDRSGCAIMVASQLLLTSSRSICKLFRRKKSSLLKKRRSIKSSASKEQIQSLFLLWIQNDSGMNFFLYTAKHDIVSKQGMLCSWG